MNNLFDYKNHFNECDEVLSNLLYGVVIDAEPLVSILIPTYNHTMYLKESILSAINQDCNFPYEIIVVDNNHELLHSSNYDIVKDIGCERVNYYLNEKNIGPCGNWNRCIQLAKGKYISFCHDDDYLKPNALSSLIDTLNLIDKKQKSPLIIGAIDKIDAVGNYLYKSNKSKKIGYEFTLRNFLEGNVTNGCGCLFLREHLIEIGGYNNLFYPCFDYALNVVYTYKFGAFYCKQATVNYRITDESDSANCYSEIPVTNENICLNIVNVIGDKFGFLHYILKVNKEVLISANSRRYENKYSLNIRNLYYRILLKVFHFYNKLNK
nr:glycosyltransferase family 2 protein [uncultured Bacteroides sp.]